MLPFWLSIGALSLAQGAIVALPATLAFERLGTVARSRMWALVPPVSIIGFVLVGRADANSSAQSLTYLALFAVPVLAALALGWLARGARPVAALAALGLFALAWADRAGLLGQAAAVALSALSCVALGVLLAALAPPRWLAAGIVAMAIADATLVVSDLLQAPNNALNGAHPAAGLPELQSAVFGSAVMGYGDLFAAAALGGLLAARGARTRQLTGAALLAALSLGFDLLLLLVNELPATVPVALALILLGEGPLRSPARAAASGAAVSPRVRTRNSAGG